MRILKSCLYAYRNDLEKREMLIMQKRLSSLFILQQPFKNIYLLGEREHKGRGKGRGRGNSLILRYFETS